VNDFNWLHFSDLHFSIDDSFNTLLARKALLNCLEQENFKCKYIFITGDVAHKNNYVSVKPFIDDVLCRISYEDIFWAAGNHDIERDLTCRDTIIEDIRNAMVSPDANLNPSKIFVSAMKDNNSRDILTRIGMESYTKQYNIIFGRHLSDAEISDAHIAYSLEHCNLVVLNTCLTSCDKNDDHKLMITEPRLFSVFNKLSVKSKPLIVIGHHGKEFFHHTEHSKLAAFFEDTGVDVYLCGHSHRSSYARFDDAGRDIPQITCGGEVGSDVVFSFMFGEYTVDNQTIRITPYSYSARGAKQFQKDYSLHRRLGDKNNFILNRLAPVQIADHTKIEVSGSVVTNNTQNNPSPVTSINNIMRTPSAPDFLTPTVLQGNCGGEFTRYFGEELGRKLLDISARAINAIECGHFEDYVSVGSEMQDMGKEAESVQLINDGKSLVADGYRLLAGINSYDQTRMLLLAKKGFEVVLDNFPNNYRALRGLAVCAQAEFDYGFALKQLDMAIDAVRKGIFTQSGETKTESRKLGTRHELLRLVRHRIDTILRIRASSPQSYWNSEQGMQALTCLVNEHERLYGTTMKEFAHRTLWYNFECFAGLTFLADAWFTLGNTTKAIERILSALKHRRATIGASLSEVQLANLKWWLYTCREGRLLRHDLIECIEQLNNSVRLGTESDILRGIDQILSIG